MSRKHRKRPRSFSPAFDAWLRWNEHVEDYADGRRQTHPILIYHEDFFVIPDAAMGVQQMINSWVHLAKDMRSAMKFRFDHPKLQQLKNIGESYLLKNIWSETPIALPFPKTYVEIVTKAEEPTNVVMLMLEERYSEKHDDRYQENYDKLGIRPGDKFVSCSVCAYNSSGVKRGNKRDPKQKISIMPVELHIPMGPLFNVGGESNLRSLSAFPEGVDGSGFMELYNHQVLELLLMFLALCHSPNRRVRRVPGLPREARDVIKKHRRKPMESTFYEHHVLEIPIGDEEPLQIGEGTPHSRHRLHAVRGHMRHYKSGRISWIPAHWRGDKELGVVTKDYDFVIRHHED